MSDPEAVSFPKSDSSGEDPGETWRAADTGQRGPQTDVDWTSTRAAVRAQVLLGLPRLGQGVTTPESLRGCQSWSRAGAQCPTCTEANAMARLLRKRKAFVARWTDKVTGGRQDSSLSQAGLGARFKGCQQRVFLDSGLFASESVLAVRFHQGEQCRVCEC